MKTLSDLLRGLDLDGSSANSLALRNLELAQIPTAEDRAADRFQAISNQYQQNTPLTAILKGITGGVADSKRSKADQARDARLQKIQEQIDYQQQMAQYQDVVRAKMNDAVMADAEAMRSGNELANGIQSLQLGDTMPMQNWLAANPTVAKILGDDGPGGHSFDGVTPVTMNGVQYIQGFGKSGDGSMWQGKPIPVDALLQRYAPEMYAAKSSAALKDAQDRADIVKTEAEGRKAQADAMLSEAKANDPRAGLSDAMKQKLADKEAGRNDVSTVIDGLRANYLKLQDNGAIVDPNAEGLAGKTGNIFKSTASSGAGQFVGSVLGTENQAVRQEIRNSLPLLMASIKSATGMSAQQLNSNAELRFYMQAATDPSKDIQSNLAALDNLEKLFGESGARQTQQRATQPDMTRAAEIRAAYKEGKIDRASAENQLKAIGFE